MENIPTDYFLTSQQFTQRGYRDVYPAIDPILQSNSLAGKVVVITGGIGARGFALSFAKANRRGIVLVARSENSLHEVSKIIQTINSKVEALSIPVDVTDTNSVSRLWAKVKEKFGHADVLVNNAGTANGGRPLAEADPKTWWGDFETNVHGVFLITQGFLQLSAPLVLVTSTQLQLAVP